MSTAGPVVALRLRHPHAPSVERSSVRTAHGTSVADVVRQALQEKRLAVLRAAVDEGIAELDAGLGIESTPEEFMDEVLAAVGLTRQR